MKSTERDTAQFVVTEKLKQRALELLDESQAVQFVEGLRLNSAMATVFNREQKRLEAKFGADDIRTKEMADRVAASDEAKLELFARYSDAMTPPTTTKAGWAVDGFVRVASGSPVEGLTVAAFDKDGNVYKDFGRAVTDGKGFFSIKVEKFPDEPPSFVLMRAMKGRTPLESKEVRLVPVAGSSERVEIILTDRGGEKPETPNTPDKTSVPDKPTASDKASTSVPSKPAEPVKSAQPDKTSVPVSNKIGDSVKASVAVDSKSAVAISKRKTTKRSSTAKRKPGGKKDSAAKSSRKPQAKSTKGKK